MQSFEFYRISTQAIFDTPLKHQPIFLACGCDEQGSDGCDTLGVCLCKNNIQGDKCDECVDTHPEYFPDCSSKYS